jgi:type VI secretion system VasD/TssJ family lipoprotein
MIPRRFAFSCLLAVAVALVALVSACKPQPPSCQPDSVKWGLQLALQASETINPTDAGQSLPTVVRVFQTRGELAFDDLDFEALWKVTKASELGESFLGMEELTLFPEQSELRKVPVESDATHVLAAALFREPAADTWFTSYELPQNHGEVVCAKEPKTKQYPEPCFYVRLDRNSLEGGATPPAGYQVDGQLRCAPLDVVLAPEEAKTEREKRKERRQARRQKRKGIGEEPDALQKQLDGASGPEVPETPTTPEVPDPKLPKTPELPKTPKAPELPKAPKAPKAPELPKGPKPR